MEAMIFAAGLGTRLFPITKDRPKALAPFLSGTLLEYNLNYLAGQGVRHFVINTHHYAEKIEDYLKEHNNFGLEIRISHENELLNTAGGFAKALSLFTLTSDPVLLYNVDVISNFDLKKMTRNHLQNKCDISLAVRNRNSSRYLLFDADKNMCGWKNIKTGKQIPAEIPDEHDPYAFSGIQLISSHMTERFETGKAYSLIDYYLNEMNRCKITAYPHDQDYWFDCGKADTLHAAAQFIVNHETV